MPETFDPNNGEDEVILGQQLTNPSTLSNMQNAANLFWGGTAPTLQANYLYVRFLPRSSEQIEMLEDDQDLELQDFPMDYEVLQEGDYYQAPNVGTEDIGWLYSAVPKNYTPPTGIQYEIIAPLFITENTYLEDLAESIANGAVYTTLLDVNNFVTISRVDVQPNIVLKPFLRPDPCWIEADETCGGGGNGGIPPPAPLPPGIYVEEQTACSNDPRILPLRQVRVVAKRWFKIWKGYTDNNGRFTVTKRFKNKVKVIVKTKNANAKICKVRGARLW